MSVAEAVVRWWLAFTLLTVALAPIVWWMAEGLGAYRHALLRPVGLVVATFIVWWPAALIGLPFQRETVIAGVLILGVAGWISVLRRPSSPIRDTGHLALFELVSVIGLLGYVAFRTANPDIANTEKPMEIALLSSIVNSTDVPAPDPWFAGLPINYYYFGYQSVATLVHLSGVEASVAFNLMLASIFASTLTVAAGLGAWLAERAQLARSAVWVSGALAAFFVGVAGNLETFSRLITSPVDTISAGWWDGVGWQASRVIVDVGVNGNPAEVETINEFPAFSFVLGDLHPHLTTLPMLLATVALAAGIAIDRRLCTHWRVAAIGAFAGLLYASNSWDAPVGVVVVVGALLIAFRSIDRALLERVGIAVLGAGLAALPFALNYTAPVGVSTTDVPEWFARIPVLGTLPDTIAIVTWRPSSAGEVLTVHGLWIVSGSLFAIWTLATSSSLVMRLKGWLYILAPVALILVAVSLAWSPALVLLGLPAAVFLVAVTWDDRTPVRIVSGIFACGFGLALIPEFLYIQDSFGSRMNTVFKLNFQSWLFLGVASAAGLVVVAASTDTRFRRVGFVAIVLIVVMASPYFLLSAEDWMEMGVASGTLDGAAYLDETNPSESNAIDWLADNATSDDVIVESPGCAYQVMNGVPMNRFSAFTGVPTLLGWANHERQWRRGEFDDLSAVIGSRDALANSWLNGQPGATPADIEPRFIVFGTIERSASERCPMLVARGSEQIAALQALGWQVAFEDGETIIVARADDPVLSAAIEVD